jgi:hypothetical protein
MVARIAPAACLSLALLLATSPGTGAAAPGKKPAPGTPAPTSWIKRLPLVYLDDPGAATLTRDGNLVVGIHALGREFTPNYMEFVKLAPDGKVLWRQRLANSESAGAQTCELPTKLREAVDGSLLVAGHRCRDTRPHAWFARLDAKANPLWQVTPYQGLPPGLGPVVTDTYGWDLVERGDGQLLGLGFGSSREGNVWWLDITAEGRVVRSRAAFWASQIDEIYRGLYTGGQSARGVRVGITTMNNPGKDVRIGWLDRNLQFRDEVTLAGPRDEEVWGLDASPDGGFCALIRVDLEGQYVQRHAADGGLVWQRAIDDTLVSRLLALRDGGCLVSGGPEAERGTGKTLRLRKYAANGDLAWDQAIAGRLTPRVLLEAPTGGLFVVGYETPPNHEGSAPYVLYLAPGDLGKAKVKPAKR